MAVITCTRANLITEGKCFTESVWSQKEQEALMVYLMAALLTTLGGTDYTSSTSSLTSTLLTDAEDMTCGMSPDQREAAAIAILKSLSGVHKTTEQMADEIRCLRNATQLQLDQAKVHLLCGIANAITIA